MTFDSFVKLPEGIIYLVMGLTNLVTGMIQVVSIHIDSEDKSTNHGLTS